jgi:hypothetical protein
MGQSLNTLAMPKTKFLHTFLLCILLASKVAADSPLVYFSSNDCQQRLVDQHSNNKTYLGHGSTLDYVRLTYKTCLDVCGTKTGKFDPIVPRLNTWLLPVLFLLANSQFPMADLKGSSGLIKKLWGKTLVAVETLAHILGDPVDYAITLLSQIEIWNECLELAENLRKEEDKLDGRNAAAQNRNMAIILTAFERVLCHHRNEEVAKQYFTEIVNALKMPMDTLPELNEEGTENRWASTVKYEAKIARNFVVVRRRHLAPANFAVAFYAWQVVGAFVPVIGASPNPSGGRVSAALTLSWIIFIILFSNTIGEVASRTTYADTIEKYLKRRPLTFINPNPEAARDEFDRALHDSLGTTSSTGYCYRLVRQYDRENKRKLPTQSRHVFRAIAHMPVLVAVGSALAVTSLPPTYFSVRHYFFFAVGIMYHIISPSLTLILRRWHLFAVRVKNILVAAGMIAIFIANGCGMFFNNCRGWETIYPKEQGLVIYSKRDYARNAKIWFPTITSLCIGTQIALCVIVSWMSSRARAIMKLADSS